MFDATTDVGVPCYEAHAWSSTLPIFFRGAGCHLDPVVALSRALTEAAQARLTTITGTRDDLHERLYTLQSGPPARPPADLTGSTSSF